MDTSWHLHAVHTSIRRNCMNLLHWSTLVGASPMNIVNCWQHPTQWGIIFCHLPFQAVRQGNSVDRLAVSESVHHHLRLRTWEQGRGSLDASWFCMIHCVPSGNFKIAMENITMFNGKIHHKILYKWQFSIVILNMIYCDDAMHQWPCHGPGRRGGFRAGRISLAMLGAGVEDLENGHLQCASCTLLARESRIHIYPMYAH